MFMTAFPTVARQSSARRAGLDMASAWLDQPPGFIASLKERFLLGFTTRGRTLDPGRTIPLTTVPSPHVDGMRLVRPATRVQEVNRNPPSRGVIVGAVRMGFGHHRIAHSATTWAVAMGAEPWLHDLLEIPSPEADAIAGLDAWYSRWSRRAADIGGLVDWAWGRLMQQGDLDSLRFYCRLAELLSPLMKDLPREMPVVTAYPLNGQIAVACGFRRVVNLVVDNYPQPFLLVPGALNVVQTPHYFMRLRQSGLSKDVVAFGGHWVSHGVGANAASDCALRIVRADQRKPLRLLIPVGGAGAQRVYLTTLLRGLEPRLRDGSVRVLLNTGDHVHMVKAFEDTLSSMNLTFRRVDSYADLRAFCSAHPLEGDDPEPVVLFHFPLHFEAFSATDLLVRVSDILVTKPSELAFFPVPKLHIRRVGNHEAASALRAAELGDGTPECRSVADGLALAQKMVDDRDIQRRMCEDIVRNSQIGVYDGSRRALEMAFDDAQPWDRIRGGL